MVVKSILNRKIIFVIVFLEIRYSFIKNLKLPLGMKRVTHTSLILNTKNSKNY